MSRISSIFFLLGIFLSTNCLANENRYPLTFPFWLWRDDPRYSILVDQETRDKFDQLQSEAARLREEEKHSEAQKADTESRTLLHRQLAVRDFIKGADILTDPTTGHRLALHLDPLFPKDMQPVLRSAVSLYLAYATNPEVVEKAYMNATERAQPFPLETVDGSPNPEYWLFASSMSKPPSTGYFTQQMDTALAPANGSIPLLVISSFSGNPWWGGGIYDVYNMPEFNLTRNGRDQYFYIRLHTDKMQAGSIRFDDPKFWASKVAHEILHNMGYWHPEFADPAERDRVSRPGEMAFIVAYERAMLENLDK